MAQIAYDQDELELQRNNENIGPVCHFSISDWSIFCFIYYKVSFVEEYEPNVHVRSAPPKEWVVVRESIFEFVGLEDMGTQVSFWT